MRIYLLTIVLILGACTESIDDQHSRARDELAQVELHLENASITCAHGRGRSIDEVREEALAEWDAAVGDNLDNISPEQEWEIRKSLGAQMGLAPSEVNGWKDIYRNRAEQAKRILNKRNGSGNVKDEFWQKQQKVACDSVPEARKVVDLQKTELARLKKELMTSGNKPGFLTYLVYLIAALAAAFAAFMVLGTRHENRKLTKIKVDGLLTQAEIFKNKLSAEQWQEILRLHAARDFDALKVLVRKLAPPNLKDHIIQ